MAVIFTLF